MGNFRLLSMYYAVCKIALSYCFTLVLHFKFVPHTIIHVYLNFIVRMFDIFLAFVCALLLYIYIQYCSIILMWNSQKIVSIKKLCLNMYNTQYKVTVYILTMKYISNAIVEMDRPIISN